MGLTGMRQNPTNSSFPLLGVRFCWQAFTLVEILVSLAVLSMILLAMGSIISSVQRVAMQTSSRVEQFREARRAFERINQRLSQATLNAYWDYVDSNGNPRTSANAGNFTPFKYARLSELRYMQTSAVALNAPHGGSLAGQAVFFQAPLGQTDASNLSSMNSLLNTIGYYLEKCSETSLRPAVLQTPDRVRYRLFELTEPSENLVLYSYTSGSDAYNGTGWYTAPLAVRSDSTRLADNVVALLFLAQYTDATGADVQTFSYSSAPKNFSNQAIEENNLPSSVRVTMVAVDEAAAKRINDQNISLNDVQDNASLSTLETQLIAHHLNYRKFESVLFIQAAKWSVK
jgi:uncharacterized protein (TIGR02599 family)